MLKSSTLSEIAEDFLLESNVDEGVLLVALEAAFRERGRKTSSRKNEEKKTKAKSKGKEKEKETQTRRKRKRTNRIHLANRKEERLVHLIWKIHELKEKDSQTHSATTPNPHLQVVWMREREVPIYSPSAYGQDGIGRLGEGEWWQRRRRGSRLKQRTSVYAEASPHSLR